MFSEIWKLVMEQIHHKQLIAAWNTLGKNILYIFLRPLVQRTFQLWIIMYKFHNCSHHEVYTKLGELIFAIYWPLINRRQYPQECFWLGIKCIQTYPFKNCSEGRVFWDNRLRSSLVDETHEEISLYVFAFLREVVCMVIAQRAICHGRVVITRFNRCRHALTYKMASCILVYTDPTRVNVTKSSFWTVLIDATLFGTSLHHSSEMPRWHMRRQARNKLLFIKKKKGRKKRKITFSHW